MIFLFNKHSNNHKFYQAFYNADKYVTNDESVIYDLTKSNFDELDVKNIHNYNFKILTIDNLISYKNLDNNQTNQFLFLINVIDSDKNKLIFENIYNKIESNEFPIFIDSDYDNIYYVNFKISQINTNLFLINEKNMNTQITKKYILSTDIDLVLNFK